ncbi:MAG: glycosyl transferase [Rhodobacter sp.]|nr:glycosyl transferase [Rhodobacter sp.]
MTGSAPLFTVIMATWGRGRHILPSVTSVLQQSFKDFELIVVGDACVDETEAVLAEVKDPRVKWFNLTSRCGSQSAPNNAGIAASRGSIIAYLGHDDVWDPNHLAEVARAFASPEAPDFVVSGLIAHLPNGLKGSAVMGLFGEDSDKHRYFFPPSSFAHRKTIVDQIGPWGMPKDLRPPVDAEFLLRAAAANLRFVSTGVVTVHKFTSVLRYLAYLQQSSDEQEEMLADFAAPDHSLRMANIVETSRQMGKFMLEARSGYDDLEPGELARIASERRGLSGKALHLPAAGAVIRQVPENCWLDWQISPRFGIRLNGRNPRPRFLLPFTATTPVAVTIRAVHPDRKAFGPLGLLCNGVPITAVPTGLRPSLWGWTACYRAVIQLRADQASVLEFRLDRNQRKKHRHLRSHFGFGIGRIALRPD